MRVAYPSEPATLDPMAAGGGSAATRDILRPVLPALFRLDANLAPQPELAAAVPRANAFSFDPFTVDVRLREATWSDGRPITSSDVRFTWSKLKDGPGHYRYRHLRDVATPSPLVVRLRFDRPVRRWWALFSIDDMVLPAHAYSDDWHRAPTVSGGPFVFDEWVDGLRIRLRRNDRYWGGTVPLAGVDVLFVPDDETRLQLLDRNDVDVAFAQGDVNVGRRANAYGFAPIDGALAGQGGASNAWGPSWWELDLDPRRLGEPVARAVLEAAHPTLAAEILEDSGRPMDGIPPAFGGPERDTATPWHDRGNLTEAKAFLDAGGVPAGEERATFRLAFATTGSGGALAAYLHFRLREIGIDAELVGLEPDTFDRAAGARAGTDDARDRAPVLLRLRRGADAPDAASYGASSELPGSASVDDAITQAETDVSRERVTAGLVRGLVGDPWAEAQRGLVESASAAPLARTRTWLVARPDLWGPQATGAAHGPLWNAGTWSVGRG